MPLRRAVRLVLTGLVATGALAIVGAAGGAAAGPSTEAVPTWYQHVIATLTPLQSSLVTGVQAATAWREGHQSARSAGTGINRALTGLVSASTDLQRVQAPPAAQAAQADYVAALELYVDAFRLDAAATRLAAGTLVHQLQLSFERIRELGDVTFDQGTARLAPVLGSAVAGADVQAAAHIPDWSALAVAPGRPLVTKWSGTTAEPTATQPASAWSDAVQHLDLPTISALRRAVTARHPQRATCRRLANALDEAEVRLSAVPGPTSDQQASGLLRIAVLVEADAALTAEASTLSSGSASRALHVIGTSLASIGAQLRGTA